MIITSKKSINGRILKLYKTCEFTPYKSFYLCLKESLIIYIELKEGSYTN